MLAPARRIPSALRRHAGVKTTSTSALIITTTTVVPARYKSTSEKADKVPFDRPFNDPKPPKRVQNVSESNTLPISKQGIEDGTIVESVEAAEERRVSQAPNRKGVWSRSQQPRELAMSGTRFEQTIMELQPRPLAAIDLIHKQPVRWTDNRIVACDGGGGPLGHPKIFINVDKPQINMCTYCGLPFAHKKHEKFLKSLPQTSYPLFPANDPAEVDESQRITDEPLAQR